MVLVVLLPPLVHAGAGSPPALPAAPHGTPVGTGTAPRDAAAVRADPPFPALTTTQSMRTLVLRNSTLVPGVAAAANCPQPGPLAVGNGELFVACNHFQAIAVLNASTLSFSGVIPVPLALGSTAGDVAYVPWTDSVYVQTQGIRGLSAFTNITAYNLSTGRWGPSFAAGLLAGSLLYDPADARLYQVGSSSGHVDGFDPSSGASVFQATLPSAALGSAVIDPNGGWMYVASGGSSSLYAVNLSSGSVAPPIAMYGMVSALGFDPLHDRIYAALAGGHNVSVVDGVTRQITGAVATGRSPSAVGWDPLAQEIDVANAASQNVTRINSTTQAAVGSVPTGVAGAAVVFDGARSAMIVVNTGGANVTSFDAVSGAPTGGPSLGAYPSAVAGDASLGGFVVGDFDTDTLTAYSDTSGARLAQSTLASNPMDIATDVTSGRLFVAEALPDFLQVVNGSDLSVERTIALPYPPSACTYDAYTGLVAVSSFDNSNVSLVDPGTGQIRANLSVPYPTAVAADPAIGALFVASWGGALTSNTVAVLQFDDATYALLRTSPLGGSPGYYAMVYDPVDRLLYVGNGSAVRLFDPSSLTWTGTVPAANGGSLAVDAGSGIVVDAGFRSAEAFATTSHALLASVPFADAGGGPVAALDAVGEFLIPDPSNGTVGLVRAGPAVQEFSASPSTLLLGSSSVLTVTLAAATPPVHSTWAPLPAGCVSEDSTALTCAPTVAGVLPVGVQVSDATGLVVRASLNLTVTAPVRLYNVTFVESGLPAGTAWAVVLGSNYSSSTGSSIGFSAPDGVYSFSIPTLIGELASPGSGSLSVAGADVLKPIQFSAVAPPEGFLLGWIRPADARVTVDHSPVTLIAGAFNVSLPPGTYVVSATRADYREANLTESVRAGLPTRLWINLTANLSLSCCAGTSNGSSGPSVWTSSWPWITAAVLGVIAGAILWWRRRPPRSLPVERPGEPTSEESEDPFVTSGREVP